MRSQGVTQWGRRHQRSNPDNGNPSAEAYGKFHVIREHDGHELAKLHQQSDSALGALAVATDAAIDWI